jgi:flagellar FliJ protein
VTAAFERGGSASVQDLLAIERYIARLDAKKEKLIEDLAACELVVERARGVYLEATKDRQIISKLREKKEATWRRKYLSDEAAVLDDIVNARGNAASASGQ